MNIFVISLPDSPRRKVIESWLNYPFEYIEGVRVTRGNRRGLLEIWGVSSDLPNGDLGCAKAHLTAYETIAFSRKYKDGALILEDDAYPLPIAASIPNRDKPHAWYRKCVAEVGYQVGDGFDFIGLITQEKWGFQAQFVTQRGARELYYARQELVGDIAIDQYIKGGNVAGLKVTNGRPIFGHKDEGRNSERVRLNGVGN
jgi:GR25 family glycosyltransferase involved in LPS biosynthesis